MVLQVYPHQPLQGIYGGHSAHTGLLQRGSKSVEIRGLIAQLYRNGDIHRLGHRGNKAEDLSRHGAHIHAGSQRRGKTHLHGIGAHPLHLAGQVGQLAGGVAPYARDELAVAAPQ